jgi:hypothetical protein
MKTIYKRFIERDALKAKMMDSSVYINEQQIDSMLDERNDWCDLTFGFTPHGSGWKTGIYDNNIESEVTIDDLLPVAYDWYIKKVEEMSVDKGKLAIQKIRELLYA